MKEQFPGYYLPTESDFKQMWQEGLFIFDANFLLDFFRYSDDTVNSLLSIMDKIKGRIWIPHQAAYEYHKNLYSVIESEAKLYSETINKLDDLVKKYTPKKGKDVISVFDNLKQVLVNKKEGVISLLSANPIKEKLSELLKGKIGEAFNEDQLIKIYEEGQKRYEKNIPPGYCDAKDKKGNEKYGDFVFWKQILEKVKQIDTAIILVTGDIKEDWFIGKLGRIISPRPELISEVKTTKNVQFYIYPTRRFLEYGNVYFSAGVKEEVLNEVMDLEDMIRKTQRRYLEEPWNVFENIMRLAVSVGAEILDFQDSSSGGIIFVKKGTIEKPKIEMLMRLAERKGCALTIQEIEMKKVDIDDVATCQFLSPYLQND